MVEDVYESSMAKLDAVATGQLRIEVDPVDMTDLNRGTLDLMSRFAQDHGVERDGPWVILDAYGLFLEHDETFVGLSILAHAQVRDAAVGWNCTQVD